MLEIAPGDPVKKNNGTTFYAYALSSDGTLQRYLLPIKFNTCMQAEEARGLLLFDNPARMLAAKLSDGACTDETLHDWISEAGQYLSVLKRYREKIVVIERPATERERALRTFEAAFPGRRPPREFDALQGDLDALTLSIGAFAVNRDAVANRLLLELHASCAAPASETLLLSAPLGAVSRELNRLMGQVDHMKSEIGHLKQNKEEESAAKYTLLQQVSQLQTSLEETEARKMEKTKRVDELAAQIDLIYRSTSWRITAPVRAIRRLAHR